ncbi:hypothetical protein [Sulfuriroseicoccus oceanibius]|uniref:Uncharacterized protein n=1 Tax=Sulfuriroseicoccus oceanibius TaxID=2707525 RepID=A0A7T7F0U3_9BACT|nr:hypothetical protein [Sulfuriroseicoccus oceanibius]QQL44602.1 hypothetical protein G3M56_012025 [Sulfuriroseicoccus oceanibius]
MLPYILRYGYREAREERLNEWTASRERGFLQNLVRRYSLAFIAVAVVSIWREREAGETLINSLKNSGRTLVPFFVAFVSAAYFVWRATEKEWRAWKALKNQNKAEQVGAANRDKAGGCSQDL